MSYYVWGSKMSYADYLTAKSFISDVSTATKTAGRQVSMEISRQTRDVIASNEAMARDNIRAIEANTDAMNVTEKQIKTRTITKQIEKKQTLQGICIDIKDGMGSQKTTMDFCFVPAGSYYNGSYGEHLCKNTIGPQEEGEADSGKRSLDCCDLH